MRICLSLFSFFLSFLSLSLFFFNFNYVSFPPFSSWLFVCFCLGLVAFCFSFCFFFFYIHMCLLDYRSLHSSTHIYAYTYAYILSVYSAESIFPSFSFLHNSIVLTCNPRSILVYCTSVIIPASATCCISY